MRITVASIIAAVCDYYNIHPAVLKGSSRKRSIARPRQIAAYLARELTKQSYPEIGRRLGGRDHSTMVHSYYLIRDLKRRDPEMADDISYLRATLFLGRSANDNEAAPVPDFMAQERERERERLRRIHKLRLARVRAYLKKRKEREAGRAIQEMDDMDYLSWKVSQYAKRDKVERFG